MHLFEHRFRVNTSLEAVSLFHHDTYALKKLTPPPVIAQIHSVEPLAEGSRSTFTLWFGPVPVRWTAEHSSVDRRTGFTDTQISGPMKFWRHRHEWHAEAERTTIVTDRIEYEHHPGYRGLLTRILFAPPFLKIMFTYRKWATRAGAKRLQD